MKTKIKEFIFKDKNLGEYKFFIDSETFIPTQTTSAVINSSLPYIKKNEKVLDLGCGCGIVSIIISLLLDKKIDLYASDISNSVVSIVKKNSEKYGVDIEVRKSDVFDAWENNIFSTIINDISGVSDEVAKISPWFKNIACDTGIGGDLLVNRVIKDAPNFLEKNGQLFFPVISLSNELSILGNASQVFRSVEQVAKVYWPAPKEMLSNIDQLRELKNKGYITFEEKFGSLICFTSVYRANL